ncbi:DUF2569 family protein [Sphingomonas sp. MS122]|uniref:DUF2569 family protein n=1 Tax=Sphingomonas sp. MS122 TaxID=3412683 RepID=UPI003C309E16
MAYSDGPRGIGGWLGLFLLTLGVFSPLRIFFTAYGLFSDPQVAAAYGDRWPLLATAEVILIVLNLAAIAFLLWRFFMHRNWQSVRIGIAGIWLIPVGVTLLEIAAVSLIGGVPAGRLIAQMGPDMAQALIYSIVWTAYLLRSVRVANTYPRELPGDALVEVFE